MHSIQFNAYLRKRKNADDNTAAWIRYAKHCPKEFVTALGYPNAHLKVDDRNDSVSVVDGVKVVAYYGTLLGPEPVFVTQRGCTKPIQLFKRAAPMICVKPFGDDTANFLSDLVPNLLQYLNVHDACAIALVCKQWRRLVRSDATFWVRQANRLGARELRVANPRTFCLKTTLHGFVPSHSAKLRAVMRKRDEYRLTTWILCSFLKRKVQQVDVRDTKDFEETRSQCAVPGSFVLMAQTRDFVAMFVFVQDATILWRLSGTRTWNFTSDSQLVATYQAWLNQAM